MNRIYRITVTAVMLGGLTSAPAVASATAPIVNAAPTGGWICKKLPFFC